MLTRKAAFGRTDLFLPSATAILREVKCMGGVQRHGNACIYHMLPNAWETCRDGADPVLCWHCAEPIEDAKHCVPVPRVYDAAERSYHVYGATCSPPCAMAYVLEHTTFDRGQQLNTLVRMLRDAYGVSEVVFPAPPRPALRRYGGHFDTRQQVRAWCSLVKPPFVSYCMILEERAADGQAPETAVVEAPTPPQKVRDDDVLCEPQPPGLYTDFLQQMEGSAPAESADAASSRSKRRPPAATKGPMAKFARKGDGGGGKSQQ